MGKDIQHVFLVGAKNLGGYGGYETFINVLTQYHQNNKRIQYHVACKAAGEGKVEEKNLEGATVLSDDEFLYHNARCFKIRVPNIGPAQAIYYDVAALARCCRYIQKHNISSPVVYIMACRIGPFMPYFYRKIHQLGGVIYINPDGHEWKRSKWNALIRQYWKLSERIMVKYSDLAICDSIHIEQYIHENYDGKGISRCDPSTTFIAYGAELFSPEDLAANDRLDYWYQEKGLRAGEYYLVVGRFVPENNYETIIREFMASDTNKDLAIVTTSNDKFLNQLQQTLHFDQDSRIKFVGTVYDQDLLARIRGNAWGYFHGHEVGGTNPSLLEALASTPMNLLLDVGFNREVAENGALYWTKEDGNLTGLICQADALDETLRNRYKEMARQRIADCYSWEFICNRYEKIFLETNKLSL